MRFTFIAAFALALSGMTAAYAMAPITVELDQVTDVVKEDSLVKISGRILNQDGSPLSNHTIYIKDDIPFYDKSVIVGVAETDEKGAFSSVLKAEPIDDTFDYVIYAVHLGGSRYGFAASNAVKMTVIPTHDQDQDQSPTELPDWFRDSSKIWHDNQMSDSRFVYSIRNLMDQNIVQGSGNDGGVHIPQWVKVDAGRYYNDEITGSEFLNLLQYLISNSIMTV